MIVISIYGYGKFRISNEQRAESVRLKALLVQINIPQDAGQVLWTDLEIHQAYEDETLKALDALKVSNQWPDWVMWPECALTGRILRTEDGDWATWQINHDTLEQVRTAGPFSLIYGVNELEAEKRGDRSGDETGRPGLQFHRGDVSGEHAPDLPQAASGDFRRDDSLRGLAPFSEKNLRTTIRHGIRRLVHSGRIARTAANPRRENPVGAIPTVCFEDSVPRLTRKFTRPGPQVIINVTNDGWFKQSPAAAQHFANARFRAIELRRPMLRSANTGVSAAVDSTGSTAHPDTGVRQVLVDATGSHFTRGSLLAELKIPLRPSFSLYERIGDLGILSVVAIALILAFLKREKPPVPASR